MLQKDRQEPTTWPQLTLNYKRSTPTAITKDLQTIISTEDKEMHTK